MHLWVTAVPVRHGRSCPGRHLMVMVIVVDLSGIRTRLIPRVT
jgi:hypothetical protein